MNSLALQIQPSIRERKTLTYGGETREYLIVDAEFGIQNGTPKHWTIYKNGVLAISDAYPEPYQELGLIHEIIENNLPQDEFACKQALMEELTIASRRDIDLPKYVIFRTKFFEEMLKYYEGQDEHPLNTVRIERFKHTLELLRSL